MRILVATDAWRPQINGVVRTYERLAENALVHGSEITFLTPSEFKTLPCPTYPEIRLSVPGYAYLVERIGVIKPDAVHIATEGPLGWMTRYYCLKRGIPFTTSFIRDFPITYLAVPCAGEVDLVGLTQISQRGCRHHGRHRKPGEGTGRPRL